MDKKEKYNPYKTPEGYFDGFTAKMMGKLSEEHQHSVLDHAREGGFNVPKGYFEGLNEKILSQVDRPETKIVKLHPYRRYYIAAASIAALLALVFAIDWNPAAQLTFDNLASSDIEHYFETNDIDLPALEIAEVFPIDEITIGDILNDQLDEENVLDYLDNHVDRIEELNLDANEKP